MTQSGFQDYPSGVGSSVNLSGNSAAVTFVQALQHQVNEQDVQALIQSQKHMLVRFEKTNEMLVNCNALLASRYGDASKELKKHVHLLIEMKKDLDSVFRRIRFLKMKLSQQYPAAFSACHEVFNVLDEEDEPVEKDSSCSGQKKLQAPNPIVVACTSSSGSRGSSPSPVTSPSTSDSG